MIKNIHCFGTSFTAGGGFEFNGNNELRCTELLSAYNGINEPKEQFNFSYPGRLEKLLNGVHVINHAKQGYGNELLYRKTFDIVNDPFFKTEETLFIFEFSWLGRKEFWLNDINDYIIANYRFEKDDKVKDCTLANSWHYDSLETVSKVEAHQNLFNSFFKETYNAWNMRDVLERNLSMFFSFVRENKLNFIVTSLPKIAIEKDIDYITKNNLNIKYRTKKEKWIPADGYFNEIEEIISVEDENNSWKIKYETGGVYHDFHGGFYFNELVAHLIKNKMIELGYFVGNNVDETTLYSTYIDKFKNHKNTI